MSLGERRPSPVQRQLEAYEESWQTEHREAMVCRDLEDTLAVGTALYHLLQRAEGGWRDRVFRGAEEFASEDEQLFLRFYRLWLQVSESIVSVIPAFEARFASVEGAGDFRACVALAQRQVAGWKSPG